MQPGNPMRSFEGRAVNKESVSTGSNLPITHWIGWQLTASRNIASLERYIQQRGSFRTIENHEGT